MGKTEGGAMSDELLPCPFCGGEARIETYAGTACAVVCQMCHGGTMTMRFDDAQLAVDAWNRRAERTCRMLPGRTAGTVTARYETPGGGFVNEEFSYAVCSECGAHVMDCPSVRFCPNCGSRVEVDRWQR